MAPYVVPIIVRTVLTSPNHYRLAQSRKYCAVSPHLVIYFQAILADRTEKSVVREKNFASVEIGGEMAEA